ncbi:MAG: hypothetical protein AAGJ46_03035 [Planctomycetota bacterium]
MQGIGGFLVLMGGGSFLLNLMNMEFRLLGWIDMWGPTTGNVIRIGMLVAGVALFVMGAAANASHEESQDEDLARDAARHL